MTSVLTPERAPHSASTYHFTTRWPVAATPEEVYRTLEDVETLVRWWPSVYLDVKVLAEGNPGGVGKVVELYTKGWLPYTLRWKFRVTQANFPTGFSLEASDDFMGSGIWTFTPVDLGTEATYDWQIEAEKSLLKKLSWLLKPAFAMNHERAMKKGLESLVLELRRQCGETGVPPPPRPTFPYNLTNNRIL